MKATETHNSGRIHKFLSHQGYPFSITRSKKSFGEHKTLSLDREFHVLRIAPFHHSTGFALYQFEVAGSCSDYLLQPQIRSEWFAQLPSVVNTWTFVSWSHLNVLGLLSHELYNVQFRNKEDNLHNGQATTPFLIDSYSWSPKSNHFLITFDTVEVSRELTLLCHK